MKELNERLARWAGFEYKDTHNPECHCGETNFNWITPDGETLWGWEPDFTSDETACFKWLVPKLFNYQMTHVFGGHEATVWLGGIGCSARVVDSSPALALCRAIGYLK